MAAVLALSVAGCDKLDTGSPVVRASDGATAMMVIIACPPNDIRAVAAADLIMSLAAHVGLVTARSGGTARLIINACPSGQPTAPVLPAALRAR